MDDVLLEMKPDGHVVLGDGFSNAIRRTVRTYPMPGRWAREMAGFYQASEPFWSYPPIPDV